MRCQCSTKSIDHPAGGCQNHTRYTVKRDGVELEVCSECIFLGDLCLRDPDDELPDSEGSDCPPECREWNERPFGY
jgi:hypothetical protein